MPFLVQDQNSLKTPRKAVMCSHFPNNRQRTPLASCLRLCLLPSPNSCERNLRRTMLPDMTGLRRKVGNSEKSMGTTGGRLIFGTVRLILMRHQCTSRVEESTCDT